MLSSLTRSDTLPGPARWLCLGLANVLGRLGRLRMLEAAGPANCADSCHASGWELRMPGRLLPPCTPGSSTMHAEQSLCATVGQGNPPHGQGNLPHGGEHS